MARLFIDGFETGSLDLWDYNQQNASINSSLSGRDGNYCLSVDTSFNTSLEKNLPSRSELYVAFRLYPKNSANAIKFYYDSTLLGYLYLTGTGGNFQAKRGDGTILATGTTTIDSQVWILVEVRYKPADSGGVFQVKVNGILDIDYTGNTTSGGSSVNKIALGTNNFNYGIGYYDNIIVDDASWIGDTKIQAIKPTAAGNSTQWDPSSGSNWDCVDERPPSDTDYNYTNAADELDLFTFSDLSGSIEEIKCVQVQARAKYEGAPAATKLQLGVRLSSTNYFSASKDLTTAFKQHYHLWEQDPSTSSAWTASGVNAAGFGYKSVSS